MKSIRYALVGTGMMGHEHLKNLALLRKLSGMDLRVTALVDSDPGMLQSAAGQAADLAHPDRKISLLQDISELDPEHVDAFIVATPNFTHHQLISQLLPLRKAMLVEKPLCTNEADCSDLLDRLQDYPAPFWVGMEYRYIPATARFIERIKAGDVGRLRMLSIREYRFPFLQKVGDWNRFSEYTGGTLVEKCCHHFDLMRLIIGSESTRIYASGAIDVNHLDERYNGRTPDIIDNALVIVDFANGVRASLELCMFADGADPQEQLTAIGDLGKLEASIPGPDRFWPDADERHSTVSLQRRDRSAVEIEHVDADPQLVAAGDHHGSTYFQHERFASAVLHGSPVEVDARDGARAVRMGLISQESIRTGQALDVTNDSTA